MSSTTTFARIFLLCLASSSYFCLGEVKTPTQFDSCSLCTFVVSNLEEYGQETTREQLIHSLEKICGYVGDINCPAYISLYGSYILDLVLSREISDPQQICSNLQLCTGQENIQYEIIIPQFVDERAFYQLTQSDIPRDGPFPLNYYYRIFVGDASFTSSPNPLHLLFLETTDGDISVSMEVSTNESLVFTQTCDKSCDFDVHKPGNGVWYYIVVTVISGPTVGSDATELSFTISATHAAHPFEDVDVDDLPGQSKTPKWIWIVLALVLFSVLCITKYSLLCFCERRRRRILKRKQQMLAQDMALQEFLPPTATAATTDADIEMPSYYSGNGIVGDMPVVYYYMAPVQVPQEYPFAYQPAYFQLAPEEEQQQQE